GVHEMVAADPEAVSVAAGHNHSQLVIGEFQPSGHREGPPAQRVHAIGVDVAWQIGGPADPAYGDDVVRRYLQLHQRFLQRGEHPEIAAAGTPVGIDFALQIGHRQLTGTLYAGRHVCVSSSDHNLVHGNR